MSGRLCKLNNKENKTNITGLIAFVLESLGLFIFLFFVDLNSLKLKRAKKKKIESYAVKQVFLSRKLAKNYVRNPDERRPLFCTVPAN